MGEAPAHWDARDSTGRIKGFGTPGHSLASNVYSVWYDLIYKTVLNTSGKVCNPIYWTPDRRGSASLQPLRKPRSEKKKSPNPKTPRYRESSVGGDTRLGHST